MNKIIFPLKPQAKGSEVSDLHRALEFLGLSISANEKNKCVFGDATRKAVRKFQRDNQLEITGEVNASTADLLNRIVPEQVSAIIITGMVISSFRAGVENLRVEIVDKNVGGDKHVIDTITDSDGAFKAIITIDDLKKIRKRRPDLQARVFMGKNLLGESEVQYGYDGSNPVSFDISLSEEASTALPSEYETLAKNLSAFYKGNLRDLKENEKQKDITYLANKTGWDARAVAMAALADRFGKTTGIPSATFYALFRAGLPANEKRLYHTDATTLTMIWKKAAQQGLISQDTIKRAPEWIKKFAKLSKEKILRDPALVGVSSLKEMLVSSQLDDKQQSKFAKLYTTHRKDMPRFWKAVSETLGKKVGSRLQVDGKLGFLTINNAPLIKKLHDVAKINKSGDSIKDPVQLADWGYHRVDKWKELLNKEAGTAVPDEIPGETKKEKRENYAAYLASMVRFSYPTVSVAELIKTDKLAGTASDQVHDFLSKYQGVFQIGVHPIEQFIKRNKISDAPEEVVGQIKRVQRIYQITPSDQAMACLLKNGVDAAYHVVRKQKQEFVRSYSKDMGGDDQAAITYDRAMQVHNAVLNIMVSFLTASNAPGIGVHSDPQIVSPSPMPPANAADVIAYSTLESLFGELDYCACDHCRSILSPAAYLVDLLQFIDTASPEAGKENPQSVLFQRRPDIQYLPLTCENTNTALPYIDVVNEILEYYVWNQVENDKLSLEGYEGHDTKGVASEDLLASPQNVNTTAYNALQDARFPAQLPFHQPLEYLRRYFDKFEVSLTKALECLRKSDDLERPNPADPNRPVEYGWRDILLEEIGMSRIDNEIFTTANAAPNVLLQIYGYSPNTQDQDIINGNAGANIVALSNAKQYSRRLGITYEDIVAILRTRFVNPNSDLIPRLERLGVSFADMEKLKDGNSAAADAAFDALLPTGTAAPDPAKYGGDIKAWVKNNDNYSRIMNIITLMDPTTYWTANKSYNVGDLVRPSSASVTSDLFYYECTTAGTSGAAEPGNWPTSFGNTVNDGTVVWTCRQHSSECNFGVLEFRHTDPASHSRLTAVEFVRMLRFIRLWKKTGWTVEQADASICSLYNDDLSPIKANDIDDLTKLNNGFLRLIPRLGIIMRVMKSLDLTPKKDLLSLLACFGHINTNEGMEWFVDKDGSRRPRIVPSLYRQMFLNPVILNQDSSFSDDYGTYLDGSEFLADHEEALRSAFKLTGDEFALIVADLPVNPALIDRDQNNKLLLTLKNVSAVFRRGWLAHTLKLSARELLLLIKVSGYAPFSMADLTDPAIVRLIRFVQDLRNRNLRIESALYLIWNQDLSGKSAPSKETVGSFARTLRLDLGAVERELDVKDDPDGSLAQARMALVYGGDATAFFFGLLNDTFSVDVAFSDPDGTLDNAALRQAIENASGKTDAGVPKLVYDSFRKVLSYSGVLAAQKQGDMKQAAGQGANNFKTAIDNLYTKSQEATSSFFERYPELQTPYNVYVGSNDAVATKRKILLSSIMPDLVRQRKCQKTLQAVSAVAQTDLDMSKALLDKSSEGIALHAAGQQDKPSIKDFVGLEREGLSVKFYANDTATGAVIPERDVASNLDYSPLVNGVGNPLPSNPTPNAAISGIWKGFVEAPANGFYKILIEADLGAKVALKLSDTEIAMMASSTVHSNSEPIELRAGAPYPIEIKVEKVRNVVRVQWEWTPKGQGRTVIPSRYLYPLTQYEAFRDAYIRFLKTTSLAEELRLTAGEIKYFAINADYVINADKWLNALPVIGDAADPAALLKPLRALLDYGHLKADYAPDDERLIDALKDPVAATKDASSLLYKLTRWDAAALDALLVHFGKVAGGSANRATLKNLNTFVRVHDAIILAVKMGFSGKAFIDVTTNEPDGDSIRALQGALCARYDSAGWRDLIQPISDAMRGLQRDALVAYVLHHMQSFPDSQHIDTPEKLFEYFLMDVQMEPCMLTSRIRHALSSVQLFIERCLMNLERHVSQAAIDQKQWEWKRRYRVWEANRKVFLYPENWLEPELRDDKSPFFKEIESELLQSDITEDSAATALLNYLSKLEEVAKLEPCGIYNDENNDVDHVIARTAGANRKYYYRRREGRTWTPWEQIKLDIEDNPVIPVVWHDRLLLFWLRILKQQPDTGTQPAGDQELSSGMKVSNVISSNATKVSVRASLCWSEYYNDKWQPTKTSDINHPMYIGDFVVTAEGSFDRRQLILRTSKEESGELLVHVGYPTQAWRYFRLYNTHSLPIPMGWGDKMPGGLKLRQSIEAAIKGVSPPGTPESVLDLATKILHWMLWKIINQINAGIRKKTLSENVEEIIYWLLSINVGSLPGSSLAQLAPVFSKLPETLPKLLKPYLLKHRDIEFKNQALQFYYYAPWMEQPAQCSALVNEITDRAIEPGHDLKDAWAAPFFYEDSRHVFYVKTKTEHKWINDHTGYGISIASIHPRWPEIPLLVLKTVPFKEIRPKTWSDHGPIDPRPSLVDLIPIWQFVSEDAYIHRGIGVTGNVKYGDCQIGPLGVISYNPRKR